MKKRILSLALITLIAIAVVGCANVSNNPTTTPEPVQNNRQNNQQQNNETNDPITTPAPQGNQAPAGLEAEPAEMFTFQFLNIEQLYSRFEGEGGNSWLYQAGIEFDQGGIVITAYHGELSQVRIPDTIEGFPVVAIDRNAFPLAVVRNEEVTVMPVTDVFFPPTVRVFEFGAIEVIGQAPRNTPDNLPNSITVPYGVTHLVYQSRSGVNRDVFENIRSITLPNTLVDIPSQMFEELTSLTSITIPNGVIRIGHSAFKNATSLLRIDIPESVALIGTYFGYQYGNAFYGTSWWNAQPDGVITIGKIAYMWKGEPPSDGILIIPEGAIIINNLAFFPSINLSHVTIPNSVTHIGDWAFHSEGLRNGITSVTIGNSVTHIGDSAFAYNQLTSVIIPDSVTYIGDRAFNGNQLTSVIIPDSVTEIGDWAFAGNPLDEATIERIRAINPNAFAFW